MKKEIFEWAWAHAPKGYEQDEQDKENQFNNLDNFNIVYFTWRNSSDSLSRITIKINLEEKKATISCKDGLVWRGEGSILSHMSFAYRLNQIFKIGLERYNRKDWAPLID